MATYKCPICDGDVEVTQDNLNYTECPDCKATLGINVDAEFVDGMWKDLTTLYQV